jgi:hypothetical protein
MLGLFKRVLYQVYVTIAARVIDMSDICKKNGIRVRLSSCSFPPNPRQMFVVVRWKLFSC